MNIVVKDKKTSNTFASSAAGTTSTSPESLAEALSAWEQLRASPAATSADEAYAWIKWVTASLSREDGQVLREQVYADMGVRMPTPPTLGR